MSIRDSERPTRPVARHPRRARPCRPGTAGPTPAFGHVLIAGRQVTVSYLGVTGGDAGDDGDGQGARIQQVSPGSPAADAGLQAGDLVTRVGDRTVRSWEDLVLAVRQLQAGTTVDVRVRRDDGEQTGRVRVGSRPVDS